MTHTTLRAGLTYGILALGSWGLLPLFWRHLSGVPSAEIIAHRVVWSLAFLAAIVWSTGKRAEIVTAFRSPKTLGLLAMSGALIASNWLVYVWGVHHGHLSDASLGYFVSPLLTIALGAIVLKERLSKRQTLAVAIAALGVLFKAVGEGIFPWVGISLAFSISLYSFIRKQVGISSLAGLTVETALLTPVALGYIALLSAQGTSHMVTMGDSNTLLLVATGVVTSLPLLWFVRASQLLPLSTLGIVQYLSPTLQLLLAIYVFNEPTTSTSLLAFCIIWGAIALYLSDGLRAPKA